jgi:hypothetical protein
VLRPDGQVQIEDLSDDDPVLGSWEVHVSPSEMVEPTPRRLKITPWRSEVWTKDIIKS